MKIEIELSELEALRFENSKQSKELKDLRKKLNDLSEEEMKRKGVDHSQALFSHYIECVFEQLGFKNEKLEPVWFPFRESYFSDFPYVDGRKLKMDIGANIRGLFREAFLEIRVICDDEK